MTEFRNLTPFPAQAFEGIDQRGEPFHVVALRQTLALTVDGLVYADEQESLRDEDAYSRGIGRSGVREESDLCQFKPKCDVIINGQAHAPRGIAAKRFAVRLRMYQRGDPVALPPPPQGLNPLMSAGPEEMRAWRETCARLQGQELPGNMLIDKTLYVTGPRRFHRRTSGARVIARLCSWLSLGLLRPPLWRLTSPEPCVSVPLMPELAFGGECRVSKNDAAAARVPKRFRLEADDQNESTVAHSAFAANPVGVGWTEGWFLRATGARSMKAPQIEHPDVPIDINLFTQAVAGKLPKILQYRDASFGVRPKGHPERSALTGTVDEAFVISDRWLPHDFDFAVWNAAPPDQQIDFPGGGEVIELTNLCAADTPGAIVDSKGNSVLRFSLRGDLPFVLVRFENGAIGELPARLDTVLIDTERMRLSCVWRATMPMHPAVRVLEARMIDASGIAALKSQIAETSLPTVEAPHG